MATKRPKPDKPRSGSNAASAATPAAARSKATTAPKSAPAAQRTIRETVESIAVAFVLAFLFRTFEAEAFVIPTGSMAPTLQGRHKDLVCPECQFRYRVSASNEVDQEGRSKGPAAEVVKGTCPNCRFTLDFEKAARNGHEWPTYNGDRILVAKFPYDFASPDRWDVVVFRFPGDAKMNYIKRLVGRPRETVRIRHGDIYVKPGEGDSEHGSSSDSGVREFDIAHKPPDKVRAMSQTVYDNDYVVDAMTSAGWPLRWQSWPAMSSAADDGVAADRWQSSDGGRSFRVEAGQGDAWLRYQHLIPYAGDWEDIKEGRVSGSPRPRLITDFYAYNTDEHRGTRGDPPMGQNWVGDLTLEATVTSQSSQGSVMFDLVRAGRHFQCAIELDSGDAQLKIDDAPDFHPRAHTALRGAGQHRVAFANVDRQLLLWVDGSVVHFDADTAYPAVGDDIPTRDDLAPAGIGSSGAALEVGHIVLRRDVYYIAARSTCFDRIIADYDSCDFQRLNFFEYFAEPDRWTGDCLFTHRQEVDFPLEADQFFVLGDNSPASKDSRLWPAEGIEYYVSRKLLIGKALFIYWPHSFHRLPFRVPFTTTEIPFPYFPNFQDMGFVR